MEQTIYKELKLNRVKYKDAIFLDDKNILKALIEAKKIRFISITCSIEKVRGTRDTFFLVCEYQRYATNRFKDFVSFCFDNSISIKSNFNSLTIEVI